MEFNEIASLEHSFLKVPHEHLCKTNRASQALVEAEFDLVSSKIELIQQNVLTKEQFIGEIDRLTTQLTSLKQKLNEFAAVDKKVLTTADARIKHLQDGLTTSTQQTADAWRAQRLDRIIVDHLLRIGQYDIAFELAELSGISEYVNLGVFKTARVVEEALANQDCSVALEWCQSNKSRLTKLKSTLEFKLRLQQYIELLRNGQRIEAITYASTWFTCQPERHMKDIQEAMSLLVFVKSRRLEKHEVYFSESKWDDLVQQFRRNNFALNSLPGQSTLQVTLQSGISCLKNYACFESGDNKAINCPVCSVHINSLAERLPYSHHTNSRLVCLVSGNIMNEDNPPMSLPNGYVYSRDALVAMSADDGYVICPRSQSRFKFSEAMKVYIM
eukprot:m.261933 g.261933  ORF g.261933 m.261933 type:complete len:387 (+) comp43822_c0_seq1:226-1386(+)